MWKGVCEDVSERVRGEFVYGDALAHGNKADFDFLTWQNMKKVKKEVRIKGESKLLKQNWYAVRLSLKLFGFICSFLKI